MINRLADVYRQKLILKQGDKQIDTKNNTLPTTLTNTNNKQQSVAKVVTMKPVREQTPPRQKYAPYLRVMADDEQPHEKQLQIKFDDSSVSQEYTKNRQFEVKQQLLKVVQQELYKAELPEQPCAEM